MQKQTLAQARPDLVQEWDQEKNGDLTPDDVTCGMGKKVWWRCEQGHEWETGIATRVRSPKCKHCKDPIAFEKSLQGRHPELAAQWHPIKNDLLASEVSSHSNKVFWWVCQLGHEWDAQVNNRSSGGQGCPFCSGKRITVATSFAALYPEIAQEWHPTKNELTLDKVAPKSDKFVWWLCPVNPEHEWQTQVKSRAKGSGCPYCAGQAINHTNSLRTLHPTLASQWHPTENGDLTPDNVGAHYYKHVTWQCHINGEHVWKSTVDKRVSANRSCPYCSNQRINHTNSLATCFPEVASTWHPTKNTVTAEEVAPASSQKYWWQCLEGHDWQASIASRTSLKTGCPQCSGHIASSTNNLVYDYPEIANEWDYEINYPLKPENVVRGSPQKVAWKCYKGHRWEQRISDRTKRPSLCPYCNPKRAGKYFLKEKSLGALYPEIAQEWHQSNKLTAFDVPPYARSNVMWECDAGHVWECSPTRRVNKHQQCTQCSRFRTAYIFQDILAQHENSSNIIESFGKDYRIRLLEGHGRVLAAAVIQSYFTETEIKRLVIDNYFLCQSIEKVISDSAFIRSCARPTTDRKVKNQIHTKDNNECQLCSKPCDTQGQRGRQLDHFVPWAIGGEHNESNFWTLCWECNRSKHDKFPTQLHVERWVSSGRSLPSSYHELLHLYQSFKE